MLTLYTRQLLKENRIQSVPVLESKSRFCLGLIDMLDVVQYVCRDLKQLLTNTPQG